MWYKSANSGCAVLFQVPSHEHTEGNREGIQQRKGETRKLKKRDRVEKEKENDMSHETVVVTV